jgi:hypothetical protein
MMRMHRMSRADDCSAAALGAVTWEAGLTPLDGGADVGARVPAATMREGEI